MNTLQPRDHWARTLEWTPPRRRPLSDRVFDGEAVLYDSVTGQTHRPQPDGAVCLAQLRR